MLVARNDTGPRVHPDAKVAASATIVGNVRIGARCYVDHNAVIESSGPSVVLGAETIVLPGAVIRSVGGSSRPEFPVEIGERTLVSPLCVLTGCRVGRNCYIATAAVLLQGSVVGDHARVGANAIVHAKTVVPDRARVGMRHIAAPAADGFISTADIELARHAVAAADFFETAFGVADGDPAALHEQVISTLLEETHGWRDEPFT
jgi:carbonic anhydrase/acetyltransferase-like protein (isoleucine patch superfamily)